MSSGTRTAPGFEGDVDYPNAWRYRDYVIKSFNDDKPYDRFVQEQIAADELWPDRQEGDGTFSPPLKNLERLEARVGTGLYAFGPQIQESQMDGPKLRHEWLTDAVDTTGAAFLGLTLECARCHNHKFDPIPQKDYYGLQAIFAASEPATIPVVDGFSSSHRDENYQLLIAVDEARRGYRQFEKKVKDRVIESAKKEFPAEVVQAFEVPEKERTAEQNELAAPLVEAYEEIKIVEHLTAEERDRHQKLIDSMVKSLLAGLFPASTCLAADTLSGCGNSVKRQELARSLQIGPHCRLAFTHAATAGTWMYNALIGN